MDTARRQATGRSGNTGSSDVQAIRRDTMYPPRALARVSHPRVRLDHQHGSRAMARYVILNTIDWDGCRDLAAGEVVEEQVMERLTGCAWLFQLADGVEAVEDAARAAVERFLTSDEGRRVLASEEFDELAWEDAMAWVPDETWAQVGLTPIRHPDVERVVLDAGERLRPARPPR